MSTPFRLESKLPNVGTTIFTVMSKLAADVGAINLSQGFPDFDCDPALIDAVTRHMREGRNQYAPMQGVPALRQAIAAKYELFHGRRYDPDAEVTVTSGEQRRSSMPWPRSAGLATKPSSSNPATTATFRPSS